MELTRSNVKDAKTLLKENRIKLGDENMSEENLSQNENTSEKTVYKIFEQKEDYEKFLNETRTKLTPEIRKQIEKEAKMTAEQKLQSRIDELEKDKKALAIDKNKTKAERLFVAKGISEGAYTELLNFIVDEDEKITLDRTNMLLKFVDTASKIIADEKIKSTMKDVKSPKSGTESKNSDEIGIAKILGKMRATSEKTAKETVNKYL